MNAFLGFPFNPLFLHDVMWRGYLSRPHLTHYSKKLRRKWTTRCSVRHSSFQQQQIVKVRSGIFCGAPLTMNGRAFINESSSQKILPPCPTLPVPFSALPEGGGTYDRWLMIEITYLSIERNNSKNSYAVKW